MFIETDVKDLRSSLHRAACLPGSARKLKACACFPMTFSLVTCNSAGC